MFVLLDTMCARTLLLDGDGAVQAQGSATKQSRRRALQRAQLNGGERRTSEALLQAADARAPQDAMCQLRMPGLLVDQGVAVGPRPHLVGHSDGFPPSRARLRTNTMLQV